MNRSILIEYDDILIRSTEIADLDYVISTESNKDNSVYVAIWTKQQHIDAINNYDIAHLIIEEKETGKKVGYILIFGLTNQHHSIEFKRLVISEKGKGFGRQTIRAIKKAAFEKLNAHRLWLDVFTFNERAYQLYLSEGFKEEGRLRDCIFKDGEYYTLIVMSFLEDEYISEK